MAVFYLHWWTYRDQLRSPPTGQMWLSRDLSLHVSKIQQWAAQALQWGACVGWAKSCTVWYEKLAWQKARWPANKWLHFRGTKPRPAEKCFAFISWGLLEVWPSCHFHCCCWKALSALVPKVKPTGIQLGDYSRRERQWELVVSLHSLVPFKLC